MSPSIEKTPSVISSLSPGHAVERGQPFLGVRDVAMTEDVDFRARETAAVDDAGVVQFVGDDVIFRAENRRYGSCVGRESGLKNDACLDIFERGDAPLQLDMQAHGAGDGPHGAGSRAVAPGRVDGRLHQLRVIGEPEIIIRRKIDDFLAVEPRDGLARAIPVREGAETCPLCASFRVVR